MFPISNGTVNTCEGLFTDTGGANDEYANNENFVYTICSDDPDFISVLEFQEFQLQDGVDTMIIYDSDTNDPAFEIGTFTGDLANNPQLQSIIATEDSPSGCLTIEFISDGSVTDIGWSAYISCKERFLISDGPVVNTCSGNFFDSGGQDGNYSNDENQIYTICPDASNLFTILEFQEFQLQNGTDTMIIYDSDTNDPLAEIGTFTGNLADNPELQLIAATANNPTRCLTIEFISDGSTTDLGWVAEINCQENTFPISNNTVNTCDGLFTDSGGANAEYTNNENLVYTICSDDPDYISVLEFEEFQLQDGVDTMIIYDSDTNDPAFEIGTFTGDLANNPELQSIIANESSPSGCLTVEFISDGTTTDLGWSAYISCKERFLISDGPVVNTCSGNFFDSGGQDGNYTAGENFVYTICPDGPNLQTILEFTAFTLANDGVDEMTIYDADTADPNAVLGTFSGTLAGNPELNLIVATNANPSGCLTVVFTSNTFFNAPGWEAAISCRPPCQTITPEVANISPICSTDNSGQEFVNINQPITFVGDATTSSGITDDLTYEWNFQGAVLTGQSVDQIFTNSGDVDIELTVTDSFGCFETLTFTITVGENLILVDDTQFTLDQLVNGVLIEGACSIVENIISPLSAEASSAGFDSYGYFNRGCSNFPFEDGIVLASEGVSGIPTGIPSENPFGPGDPDLSALGGGVTNDATVIEFDFTPFVDQISFNYLFASDEYNFPSLSFVCTYADTFAFILSGPGISNTNDYDHDANPSTPDLTLDLGGLNIALVPETNVPVSAVNVHTNDSCGAGSLGEFAFPQFFDGANVPPNYHKYDGQMRVLTAQADVIPGQVYHIKLAISDFSDSILNSAVFLEGGSFELGANVGDDRLVLDNTVACEDDVVTLEVFNGQPPTGFTFQWTQDGVPIPGETGATLNVTETK
ncbi:choice-of-anchor L domain-containing protein [Flavobacterium sp. CS20]|uniref:choice-of-anchor L domain-containing protein n=1 Tax=Flavobacterium sp. CS20 TaxID=2775246 RepID=UPI001B3A3AAE|nr:choice-of-anchor L domain-containing protein [Flavobacterium sp. CS20]QTY26137.1 choice-of-anchor L domain-containing protein [Flavobacterium sp. CS20]